jgi:hypothetical protein
LAKLLFGEIVYRIINPVNGTPALASQVQVFTG